MSKNTLAVLLVVFALMACTKTINIDVKRSDAKIVIEGNITNETGPYQVQLSKTLNLSETINYNGVSGAVVLITDKISNITDTLSETSTGIYTTHSIQGIVGHSYDLFVSSEGKTYTASSTMPYPVPFDSIAFLREDDGFNTVCYFQDPAGIANYYTFNYLGRRLNNTSVFSDRLSDGKYITQEARGGGDNIEVGDTVLVQMNCVDKNVWDYFNSMAEGLGFASPTPANPTSNISNTALGYFSAHSIQTKFKVAH